MPADSTPAQIYTLFNNRLVEPQKNREDMNLEDVKKRPRFKDCASDADVFRLMDQLEEEPRQGTYPYEREHRPEGQGEDLRRQG